MANKLNTAGFTLGELSRMRDDVLVAVRAAGFVRDDQAAQAIRALARVLAHLLEVNVR